MRKSVLLTSFLLASSFLSGCGGTNPGGGSTVDSNAKSVFLNCKEKVDVVKNSISELTMDESGEYEEPARTLRKNDKFYNELRKERYLSLQNFGLYILNNVYHCVTFGYDSESVPLDALIYDEVNNELDANLRNYLQTNNLTTQFYMQIEKGDSDYTFKVDWLGKEGLRGGIYVGGKIEMDGDNVIKFTVNSFTQDESCYAFTAHYDFIANNFYMLCFAVDRGIGVDLLNDTLTVISKLNNGTLEYSDVEEKDYSNIYVSSGKITKNTSEINYQGYVRSNYFDASVDEETFVTLFNTVKNKFTAAKIRTSSDKLDYSQSRRVHYMNTALKYGLDTTKLFVTNNGSAVFPFVGCQEFARMCDDVPSSFKVIFDKAKSKLSNNKSDASLFLEDDEMKLSIDYKNEQYFYLNTYTVDSVNYEIIDKKTDEILTFVVKGGKICNIKTTNLDFVPDDDPNYEVTIRFMHGFGHYAEDLLSKLIDSFNAEYMGKYKIQLYSAGTVQNVVENIRYNAAAGIVDNIPEIIITKSDLLETLVKEDATRKYLYNFDSFFEKSSVGFSDEEFDKFDQVLLADGTSYSEEGRWGLPFNTSDQYMFYNKSLFEGETKQYDLPTTFEELVSVAQQIKNNTTDPSYIPVAFSDTKNILMDLFIQNDIPFLTDKTNPFEFTSSEYKTKMLEILNTFDSCVDQGLFSSKDITGSYVNALFNDNRCAIGFMQADAVSYFNPENIGVAKVPFANGKQMYARGGCVSSISLLKTGNPYATKGAWLFIKQLLLEFNVNYSLSRCFMPALKFDLDDVQVNDTVRNVATIHNSIKDDFVNLIKVENIDAIYGQLDNVFTSFKQGYTPEQVYNELLAVAH